MTAEDLTKVNEMLKTIDVKGKGYVQVSERIKAFRSICPMGTIQTEIVSLENGVVTMRSSILDPAGRVLATGYAQEKETSSNVNKTSFVENCETSAVGRALGFLGIGVDASVASAEEVANAILNQNKAAEQKPEEKKAVEKKPQRRLATQPQIETLIKKLEADAIPVEIVLEKCKVKKLPDLSEAQLRNMYEHWEQLKACAKEEGKK